MNASDACVLLSCLCGVPFHRTTQILFQTTIKTSRRSKLVNFWGALHLLYMLKSFFYHLNVSAYVHSCINHLFHTITPLGTHLNCVWRSKWMNELWSCSALIWCIKQGGQRKRHSIRNMSSHRRPHLQDPAPLGVADDVLTGMKHAQCHAVQQDHQHGRSLEPRGDEKLRKVTKHGT